jgi:hypothetical protein
VTSVMWNLVMVRLETLFVSVQDRSRFAPKVPSAHKLFWKHPMVPISDESQVEACLGPFGNSDNIDTR